LRNGVWTGSERTVKWVLASKGEEASGGYEEKRGWESLERRSLSKKRMVFPALSRGGKAELGREKQRATKRKSNTSDGL